MKLTLDTRISFKKVEAMKFLGTFENLEQKKKWDDSIEYSADSFEVYKDKAYDFLKFVLANDMRISNNVRWEAKLS